MIEVNKNGVKMQVECITARDRILKILTRIYKPEFLLEVHKKVRQYEEVFLEASGGSNKEPDTAIHYLIHLDIRENFDVEPPLGTWIIAFYIDKKHVEQAFKAAKAMKAKFKNMNEWDSTEEFTVAPEDAIELPIEEDRE